MVRKRCNKILTELEEGNYLPKKLAKAMSVVTYIRSKSWEVWVFSQSEFFPFAKETISLQNDILNALWSLPKIKPEKLKWLRPILEHDSKVERAHLRAALRNYLTECLFGCDDDLPDEARYYVSQSQCAGGLRGGPELSGRVVPYWFGRQSSINLDRGLRRWWWSCGSRCTHSVKLIDLYV
jgi:hypothetical protein